VSAAPTDPAARGYAGATRLYAILRGWIITEPLLDQLAADLPDEGTIADLGCGIGLAALHLARRKPRARLLGLDRDSARIASATAAATRLGLPNATFATRDLQAEAPLEPLAGAYLIDILHHVHPPEAARLLDAVFRALAPGGRIAVKEVDVHPWWKRAVCHLTDAVMAPGCPVYFRPAAHWREQLERAGFTDVRSAPFLSWQPYPHLMLTARKPARA